MHNGSLIHGTASVADSAQLYDGTVVWSGAVVGYNVRCGPGCVIGSNTYIGHDSELGESVRLQHGAFIPNRTKIGSYVFIGPNATLCDDAHPRVNNPSYDARPPRLQDYCSIGAGAVILAGVTIGKHAMVGAGAVVITDVPDWCVVVGNPAVVKSIIKPDPYTLLWKTEKQEVHSNE
ncbi:MAG: acyltransferase [Nitrososphaerales archaeon]